jgi:hypothetical protein
MYITKCYLNKCFTKLETVLYDIWKFGPGFEIYEEQNDIDNIDSIVYL